MAKLYKGAMCLVWHRIVERDGVRKTEGCPRPLSRKKMKQLMRQNSLATRGRSLARLFGRIQGGKEHRMARERAAMLAAMKKSGFAGPIPGGK